MGYTLAMSDEIRDWLTDLRSTDPATATSVAEALTALISEGAGLGPPLVTPVTSHRRPVTLADSLDGTYQAVLEKLQFIRRRVADLATDAARLRKRIAALETARGPVDSEELSQLRRRLATADEAERKLTLQSRRTQGLIDAFRTRKEVLKARYTALRSELFVQQILDQLSMETDPEGASDQDAGPAAAPGVGKPAEAGAGQAGEGPADAGGSAGEPRSAEAATAGASAADPGSAGESGPADQEISRIEREIQQEIERALSPASAGDGTRGPRPELLELRPGAPDAVQIRVLFGAEPAGTALLISVLEGGEALRDHYGEAVSLSAEVLQQARDGDAPEAAAHTFASPGDFLGEFFPDQADRISAAAGDLAARNRGRTLAAERSRLGLTQAGIAAQMGRTPDQVAAIEQAGTDTADIRALAGYVRALGGRLEIIADLGGERVPLRGPTEPPN